jgi:hypothetical protein
MRKFRFIAMIDGVKIEIRTTADSIFKAREHIKKTFNIQDKDLSLIEAPARRNTTH